MTYRIVHYMNQFFAGIGGEEKAETEPQTRAGLVGPGMAFKAAFGQDAEIVGTVICGDGYFAEHMETATAQILKMIAEYKPDAVVAGPAFNAGRYGTACGAVADAVQKQLGIPAVTGMYAENPGVDMYRKTVYIVPTEDSARGIKTAVPAMAKLVLAILNNGTAGSPEEGGYMERGLRVNCFTEQVGAERAVEMLIKKLKGEPFKTEYPMPDFDRVAPAQPVKDIKNATIAVVTSGGIVPKGNPDHIEASSATKYGAYSIAGVKSADEVAYATAHGGYDPTFANHDPNRVLPLDELREMEKAGDVKKLYDTFFSTVGNGTPVAAAKKFGAEIGARLKKDGVDAVILTST
jgi:glycine reductase